MGHQKDLGGAAEASSWKKKIEKADISSEAKLYMFKGLQFRGLCLKSISIHQEWTRVSVPLPSLSNTLMKGVGKCGGLANPNSLLRCEEQ